MSGNSLGKVFTVTTWGESHGKAIGTVIDGCPSGIPLDESDIQKDLDRRRPGTHFATTSRHEKDVVEILSGTFEGKTTGTPIALLIYNKDVRSADYKDLSTIFRPGHGDYTYHKKYGFRDYRGGGRSSGRETATRVAAGTVAKKIISVDGISVTAFTRELGGIVAEGNAFEMIRCNPLLCPDEKAFRMMEKKIEDARRCGDSLGGIVEVRVQGCPPGLGEPVFEKIDAEIAKAIMSIGTIKGVEIGAGFKSARMTGSQCNDPISQKGFLTNNAGGILAGITTGEEIIIRAACKPIPSIEHEQHTITSAGDPVTISIHGRHDISVIPRIIPVCEAMVSIVLADLLLRQKAKISN